MKRLILFTLLLLLVAGVANTAQVVDFNPKFNSIRVDTTGANARVTIRAANGDTLGIHFLGIDSCAWLKQIGDSLYYKACNTSDTIKLGAGGGSGTSDSIGYDTNGTAMDGYLYPSYFREGTNIVFDVTGDTLTIGGPTGSGTIDSFMVDLTNSWTADSTWMTPDDTLHIDTTDNNTQNAVTVYKDSFYVDYVAAITGVTSGWKVKGDTIFVDSVEAAGSDNDTGLVLANLGSGRPKNKLEWYAADTLWVSDSLTNAQTIVFGSQFDVVQISADSGLTIGDPTSNAATVMGSDTVRSDASGTAWLGHTNYRWGTAFLKDLDLYTGGDNGGAYDSLDVPITGDALTWTTGGVIDWRAPAGYDSSEIMTIIRDSLANDNDTSKVLGDVGTGTLDKKAEWSGQQFRLEDLTASSQIIHITAPNDELVVGDTTGGAIRLLGETQFMVDTGNGSDKRVMYAFDTLEVGGPATGDVFSWDGTRFEIQPQTGGAGTIDSIFGITPISITRGAHDTVNIDLTGYADTAELHDTLDIARAEMADSAKAYGIDSIGIDVDGTPIDTWYLNGLGLREGANVTFTMAGDTLTIAGPAGGGTIDSVFGRASGGITVIGGGAHDTLVVDTAALPLEKYLPLAGGAMTGGAADITAIEGVEAETLYVGATTDTTNLWITGAAAQTGQMSFRDSLTGIKTLAELATDLNTQNAVTVYKDSIYVKHLSTMAGLGVDGWKVKGDTIFIDTADGGAAGGGFWDTTNTDAELFFSPDNGANDTIVFITDGTERTDIDAYHNDTLALGTSDVTVVVGPAGLTQIDSANSILLYFDDFDLYTGGDNGGAYDSTDVPVNNQALTWTTGGVIGWATPSAGAATFADTSLFVVTAAGRDTVFTIRGDTAMWVWGGTIDDSLFLHNTSNGALRMESPNNLTIVQDSIIINSVPITDFEGTNLSVTAGVLNVTGGSGFWALRDSSTIVHVNDSTGDSLAFVGLTEFSVPGNMLLNQDSGAVDVIVAFGQVGADPTLQFDNAAGRFEFNDQVHVTGSVISTADLTLNGDDGAVDATITFTNPTTDGVFHYDHANQFFEANSSILATGDLAATGNLYMNNTGAAATGSLFAFGDGAAGTGSLTFDSVPNDWTFSHPLDVTGIITATGGTSTNWNDAYDSTVAWGDVSNLYLPVAGGTMTGGADVNVNAGRWTDFDYISADTIVFGGEDTSYTGHLIAYLTRLEVHNASGATINGGTPVYISGATGDIPNVDSARADGAGTMPAVGFVEHDIANGADGHVVHNGKLAGQPTDTNTVGFPVYVHATGGWTTTKPTGTNMIQRIGEITRVNATQGDIYVSGAGRSNDVPNIASANFWLGNATAVATAVTVSDDATMDNAGALTVIRADSALISGTTYLADSATRVDTAYLPFETFLKHDGTVALTGDWAAGAFDVTGIERLQAESLAIFGVMSDSLWITENVAQRGQMIFRDSVTGAKTLAQLAAGGADNDSMILNSVTALTGIVHFVQGTGMTLTKSGGAGNDSITFASTGGSPWDESAAAGDTTMRWVDGGNDTLITFDKTTSTNVDLSTGDLDSAFTLHIFGEAGTTVGDTATDLAATVFMADTARAEATSTWTIGTNTIMAKTVNADSVNATAHTDGTVDANDLAADAIDASDLIATQVIIPDDIDTTQTDFVFGAAFRTGSDVATNRFMMESEITAEIADSLDEYSLTTAIPAALDGDGLAVDGAELAVRPGNGIDTASDLVVAVAYHGIAVDASGIQVRPGAGIDTAAGLVVATLGTSVDLASEVGATLLPFANGGVNLDISSFGAAGVLGRIGGVTSEANTVAELEAMIGSPQLALATGDIYGGGHDFGGATTLEIPNAASPALTVEGQIAWDDGDHQIVVYDGAAERAITTDPSIQFTFVNPNGLGTSDTLPIYHFDARQFPAGATITEMSYTAIGTPADTAIIFYSSTATFGTPVVVDSLLMNSTSGDSPSLINTTPPADGYLWMHWPTDPGFTGRISVQIFYTLDSN